MPEAGQSILLVDDDEAKRHVTSQVLRRAGFQVIEASTGAEALSRIYEEPGLIILDVKLPDMDGFEVASRLKETPAARTPVLHLSATFVRVEDRARGLEQGAVGYLTYPVEPTVLVAHARSLLRLGRYEFERERLLRRERSARSQAEANQRRFKVLAELGRVVSQGLAPERLIEATFDVLIPSVADGVGIVRRVDASVTDFTVHVRHRDEAREPSLRAWCEDGGAQLLAAADMADFGDHGMISAPQSGWSEGSEHPDLHLVPLRFGRRSEGALLLMRSVSPRHLSEPTREFYEDLGSRVAGALAHAQAYTQMEAAQRRGREATVARNAFLEGVGRELRQPLVTVGSWLGVLERNSLTPEQKRDALEMLQQTVRGQLDLLDELSDFADVLGRRLRLRRERVDLRAELFRILASFDEVVARAHLTLATALPDGPLRVTGDPSRLEQLLVAILHHAIHLGGTDGRVRVSARIDGTLIHLTVHNAGRGLPSDALPLVFEPFWQGLPGAAGGGLGLSIPVARAIAEQHGGALDVSSGGPSDGVTFTLTLPRLREDADADAAEAPSGDTRH